MKTLADLLMETAHYHSLWGSRKMRKRMRRTYKMIKQVNRRVAAMKRNRDAGKPYFLAGLSD